MSSSEKLCDFLSLWGDIHIHLEKRKELSKRSFWKVCFHYPIGEHDNKKVFTVHSYGLFAALKQTVSDLQEFWDKEGQ